MPVAVIIDDDKQILTSFLDFFSDLGLSVHILEKPPEASYLQKINPTFIIIDCWFADQLLGPAYAKNIRELLPQAQIILTSSDQNLEQQAIISKANYWLPKPISWEKIEKIVKNHSN